ncbi:MAG: hypothetical protein COZ18_10170 [Flexibacter sp. CG_4_10_14_3_um_filter_32_15]|nr:MAG: hypothetical protein COZ18_10170 [Flexibacter sp. CG_4_10_14_3_um_filter_32_15]
MKLLQIFSKKIFIITVLASSFVLTSCEKDENKINTDCIDLANNVTTTAQAYSADLNSANCNAYKAALEVYIAGCNNQTDVSSFETALKELECE